MIAARIALVVCTLGGIGWTTYARLYLTEAHTTSMIFRKLFEACPQMGILLMLVVYATICSALPEVNRWLLLLILIAGYCLGHSLWGY